MSDLCSINILLADDDKDDCLLFEDAIQELKLAVRLNTVNDGEALMQYLSLSAPSSLPNALFLDLNMPRKNGFECLSEIKNHSVFNTIPVFIYSTSYDEEKANLLYKAGANYYICKPSNFEELKNVIQRAILIVQNKNICSTKDAYYINKHNSA